MQQVGQGKTTDDLGQVRTLDGSEPPMVLDNYHQVTRCPCCYSTEIYARGPLQYGTPIKFSSLEIKLKYVAELWSCRECKSWFVQRTLPESTTRELYRLGESGARWGAQPFEQEKTDAAISALEALTFKYVRLLDVGCSTGGLLDFAARRGSVTVGVEPSAVCGALLGRNGHQWFSTMDGPGLGEFDVISAFDVVEHLYDVSAFFKRCHQLLRPAGRLMLLTGDIASLGARLSGPRWWYLQFPEHVVFPSRKFVSCIQGFEMVFTSRTYAANQYRYPWSDVLKQLVKNVCRRNYQGFPPPGPDHWIAVLQKK